MTYIKSGICQRAARAAVSRRSLPNPIRCFNQAAGIPEDTLAASRDVLRRFGNMSSATIMFVLKKIMQQGAGRGCGMAFGPGLTIESMLFQQAA